MEVVSIVVVAVPARDVFQQLHELLVDADVFGIRLHRVDHVAIADADFLVDTTGRTSGQEHVVLCRRDGDHLDLLAVDEHVHFTEGRHVLGDLDELVHVLLVLHRDDDFDAGLHGGDRDHHTPVGLALCQGRATADGMDGLQTCMVVVDREVVGIGERAFRAKAEATGLVAVVLLGGIAVHAIDLVDHVVRNTVAMVPDRQLVLVNGDDDRRVGLPGYDVSIPCVAEHFADDSQRLVGIQGVRQDGEEFSRLGDFKRLDLFSANYSVCIEIIPMSYAHFDLLLK